MPCCVQICFVLILILRCLVYCFHACVYKNAHFSPGKRVFSEVEHRVWLGWCLVRCVLSQWSVCCFVCVFLFCLFGIFLNFALFFDFLTQNEVS